ncbi:MAG: hypothetical protein R2755_21725 [Acidimicrobiales bacterium]
MAGPGDTTIAVPPFSGMPPTAAVSGDITAMALYAGRGVTHCRRHDTAAAIVDELTEGAAALLAATAG